MDNIKKGHVFISRNNTYKRRSKKTIRIFGESDRTKNQFLSKGGNWLNYISYQEAEKLFEVWPMLERIKENSAIETKLIEAVKNENIDEWIYSLAIGNKVLDDLPHPHTNSSPTERIAMSYAKTIEHELLDTSEEVKKEIMLLFLVDIKLKIAFDGLTPLQQKILKLFYWEKKTWAEILSQLAKEKEYLSKHQAQVQRKEGIRRLAITSRITVKVYEDVMRIIERGEGK